MADCVTTKSKIEKDVSSTGTDDKLSFIRHQKEYKRSLAKDLRKKCSSLLSRGAEVTLKSSSKKSCQKYHSHLENEACPLNSNVGKSLDDNTPRRGARKNVASRERSSDIPRTWFGDREESSLAVSEDVVFTLFCDKDSKSCNNNTVNIHIDDYSTDSQLDKKFIQRSYSVDYKKNKQLKNSYEPILRRHRENKCPSPSLPLQCSLSDSCLPRLYRNSTSTHPLTSSNKDLSRKFAKSANLGIPTHEELTLGSGSLPPCLSTPNMTRKLKIPKNVKRKFLFMKRRHTDTSLVGKLKQIEDEPNTIQTVTPALVSLWKSSFGALLKDPVGLRLFQSFLKSEFSEENINFWIACEDFKLSKPEVISGASQRIYQEYIAVAAPMEINLDSATRMQTKEALENPSLAMFDRAQKRIEGLMEKDSYPRFLESSILNSSAQKP